MRAPSSYSVTTYSKRCRRPRKSAITSNRLPTTVGAGVRRRASTIPGSHSAALAKSARYAKVASAGAATWISRR